MEEEESRALTTRRPERFSLEPSNFNELQHFAQMFAQSELCPKSLRNKPHDVMIVYQMALDVGLPAMQALQNTAVINGKPSLYGEALRAVVQRHPDCEWIKDGFDTASYTAHCTVKRKGYPEPHQARFSKEDAIRAGLWSEQGNGPWAKFPKDMLAARAAGRAFRRVFADALMGFYPAAEATDIDPRAAEPELVNPGGEDYTVQGQSQDVPFQGGAAAVAGELSARGDTAESGPNAGESEQLFEAVTGDDNGPPTLRAQVPPVTASSSEGAAAQEHAQAEPLKPLDRRKVPQDIRDQIKLGGGVATADNALGGAYQHLPFSPEALLESWKAGASAWAGDVKTQAEQQMLTRLANIYWEAAAGEGYPQSNR